MADRCSAIKFAALLGSTELQPQQQRIADSGEEDESRKLIYHTLGSGKTLAALAAAEAAGDPAAAVVPAAVRPQFQAEHERFTDQQTPLSVSSYNQLARGQTNPAETLIFDEAHRLRNPGAKQTAEAIAAARKAKHLYLLTGSPIVNRPEDLAPLATMLTGQRITPKNFADRFIGTKHVHPGLLGWLKGIRPVDVPTLKNRHELARLLQDHVDYHAPDSPDVTVNEERIEVPMEHQQEQLYRAFWDQLPILLRWKLQRDYPLSQQELRRLSSFLAGPRQVGLSVLPFQKGKADPLRAFQESPKLRTAFERLSETLKQPEAKAVVASNFVTAGLSPYAAKLQEAGVPYGMFHGGLNDQERKQVVDDYNKNRLKVLLLGPAGSEGLSLKGTRLMQLLDPHWNAARGTQTVGRGVRFDSHLHLPQADRNVQVQRYYSRLPRTFPSRLLKLFYKNPNRWTEEAADHYLERMTAQKQRLNNEFLQALQEIGQAGGR